MVKIESTSQRIGNMMSDTVLELRKFNASYPYIGNCGFITNNPAKLHKALEKFKKL